ncbi:RluA family pseudouridine synthase [Marinoscillum sp.]|uniref:RluA family pseudouridine synthase n=1 Tax=Marinoscillum sp. TaxID=2024838 RepID=UPI003BAC75A7
MDKIQEHTVSVDNQLRLPDYLIGIFDELPTKSSIKKAIKAGKVSINDQIARTADIPTKDQVISLSEIDQQINPYPLALEICYEDEHLLIVNKPAGLPTSGNYFRTLTAALAHTHPQPATNGMLHSPKPVHRLDSLTSGLVIAAKTTRARYLLGQQFETGQIRKTYQALVMGKTPESGQIEKEIDGKPATTTYEKCVEIRSLKNEYLTLIRLQPTTGRTHQLRIHCAEAGFPIYGDPLYAKNTIRNKGLFLSAVRLQFQHPVTNEDMDIQIDLPSKYLNRMRNEHQRWQRNYGNR